MELNVDVLINDYIKYATMHGEATLGGDYKIGNKAVKQLIKLYKLLEHDSHLASQVLDILFKEGNISVRTWASAHALGLQIKTNEAIAILKEISATDNAGILEFNAEMTLRTYNKQGYLKFYQVPKGGE
jgi:hypothetical protein